MRTTLSNFTALLVALVGMLAILGSNMMVSAAPPPPPSKLFLLDQPKEGATFTLGDKIKVHAVKREADAKFIKANVPVRLHLQKIIPRPDINIELGTIRYNDLASKGFTFKVAEKHLKTNQTSVPYRVRAAFDYRGKHGYVDTRGFSIKRK